MPRARPKMGENGEQQSQAHRTGNQAAKLRCDDRRAAGKGPATSDWPRGGGSATKSTDRRRFAEKRRGGPSHSASVHQREKGPFPLRGKERSEGYYDDDNDWRLDRADQLAVLEKGGGRKGGPVSLNHLLNFTFAPRDVTRGGYRQQSWPRHGGSSMFSKEQFLQANCQFIVKEEGDYTVHAVDTDILVNWDLIEQVRMFCHEISSCPICLYPPRAAKITRCGHIFCWPCILHYLSLSDRAWRKCPICHESIQKKDLKSVKSLSNHQFAVGDVITMQLMARKKHSGMVMPIVQAQEPPNGQPFNLSDPIASQFEKLLSVSSSQTLHEIILDEETELNLLKREMEDEKEDPLFAVEALHLLSERKRLMTPKATDHDDRIKPTRSDKDKESAGKVENVGEYEAAFSDCEENEEDATPKEGAIVTESAPVEEEASRPDEGKKETMPSSEGHTYYFYQASDGQHLYIHPVNTKCLAKEYGGLTGCPHTVTGKIIEIERMNQTEEARKRYRFLRHLPLTCQFALCELELKPPAVSRATLRFFNEELQKRRQRRAKKAREEKKREERFDSKHHGVQQHPPLPSEFKTGPDFRETKTSLNPSAAVFIPGHDEGDSASTETELSSPPSFAQALCEGMQKKSSPPSLWPVKRRQPSSFETASSTSGVGDDELGSDPVVPSFQDSFTEALSLDVSLESTQLSPTRKAGKRRKGKQLLFSTGSQRRY